MNESMSSNRELSWSRSAWAWLVLVLGAAPGLALAQADRAPKPAAAPSWLSELPEVDTVLMATGASRTNYNAQSEAAFAVLVDFIEVRCGVDQELIGPPLIAQIPAEVMPRWREYVGNGYSKTLTRTNGGWQLFSTPSFRHEVLSRFLSASSVAAYEAALNGGAASTAPASSTAPAASGRSRRAAQQTQQAQRTQPSAAPAYQQSPAVSPPVNPNPSRPGSQSWLDQLPAVAAVEAAIVGSNARDTAARQEAAFAILCDVIETLAGRSAFSNWTMPPVATARWSEYTQAANKTHPQIAFTSRAADVYFQNLEFRERVTHTFLSPGSQAVYAANSSSMQRLRATGQLRELGKRAGSFQPGPSPAVVRSTPAPYVDETAERRRACQSRCERFCHGTGDEWSSCQRDIAFCRSGCN
jgi:hypothetical protein